MNVARLNFSHGTHDTHEKFFGWVRRAAEDLEEPVAMLQDIQGPRIRVGTFPGGSVELIPGADVLLCPGEGEGSASLIHIGHLEDAELAAGAPVLMSDGLVALEVMAPAWLGRRRTGDPRRRAARPQGCRFSRHAHPDPGDDRQGRGRSRLRHRDRGGPGRRLVRLVRG